MPYLIMSVLRYLELRGTRRGCHRRRRAAIARLDIIKREAYGNYCWAAGQRRGCGDGRE